MVVRVAAGAAFRPSNVSLFFIRITCLRLGRIHFTVNLVALQKLFMGADGADAAAFHDNDAEPLFIQLYRKAIKKVFSGSISW